MGVLLAVLAAALTATTIVLWFRWIQRVELGRRRWIVNGLLAGAIALGLLAFVQGIGTGAGILAGASVLLGGVYFGLLSLAGQSKQAPAVAVGSPLPEFSAPDQDGRPFTPSSLRGRPVLLKFFRGHW